MTNRVDRLWSSAQRYLSEGQIGAARIALESVVQRDPSHIDAHLFLGGIAWEEDRVRDSARHALDAARNLPMDAALVGDVAEALFQAGEVVAARACLDHPALAQTRSAAVLERISGLHYRLGEHAAALALLDRAKAAGSDGPQFRFSRGMQLAFNGRLDDAEAELEAALRMRGAPGRAAFELARLRPQTVERNHLADLAQRLQTAAPGSEDHAAIEFARYKELEDLGRYDEAWESLARGNAMLYARQQHDPEQARRVFEGLVERCTAQFVQPADVVHAGPQPIFIIGMPRSGTTLLDRILGNHSQVTSAGELDDFALQLRWAADHRSTLDETILQRLPDLDYPELGRRYLQQTQWRARGTPFYTDKLPRNWMVAGLIRRALPQARILHLARDPMDVCFSNFRVMFADAFAHIYDLDALAAHYNQYRRTLQHWHAVMPGQILDVPYDELVRDPEAMARKVFAFCGLDWEPGCVDLTRNTRAVATLSAAQVRTSIHAKAFDEWRRYERQLAGLQRAVAPWSATEST
ncbi:MAG: tetratricopeptide repeat-containing sulfotransferase family protein [Lysobacterales bacterium]